MALIASPEPFSGRDDPNGSSASLGIQVNAVAPGSVDTAMAKAVHTPEIRAAYHDAIPLNRYGLEEELAEAIFVCSDRAKLHHRADDCRGRWSRGQRASGCQHCVPTFTGNTGRPKASRVSRGPAYTKNPSEDAA
jgi:Enoyl-(Acyl carrier protein) reductase